VKNALQGMIGIQKISIEGDEIEIQYDLMLVTVEQITSKLAKIGVELGPCWVGHLKLALINNLEETEIGSLEVHFDKYCD
jgi:hypothetical protein